MSLMLPIPSSYPAGTAFHSGRKQPARSRIACAFQGPLEPRLITPRDVASSLRGGGNVPQIVDVMPSAFPPISSWSSRSTRRAGNWSSYPPHKHDVHNPARRGGFGRNLLLPDQRRALHSSISTATEPGSEQIVKARDGDVVLVDSGYHAWLGSGL